MKSKAWDDISNQNALKKTSYPTARRQLIFAHCMCRDYPSSGSLFFGKFSKTQRQKAEQQYSIWEVPP